MASVTDFSNIIICDDHYVSALGIEMLLRECSQKNLQIRIASTGKKALDYIHQEPADLIIVDLGLPDISGLDVIKQIRNGSNQPYIIVLTGASESHILRQVYQLKVNGILRKTSTGKNLGEALHFLMIHQDQTYLDPSVSSLLQTSVDQAPTRREYEVLELMAQGLTSDEIAKKMNCSITTIKTYRARIMNKSGARNSSELMAWYLKGNGNKNLGSHT